jgi:cytosine/adenosine deaminase-related metal-dependent hydrolase
VHVGLGTDMNAAPNVFAEMRAAEYLQRVKKLKMGCLPRTKIGSNPEPARIFDMGTRWGAEALGVAAGALEAGAWGDMLVIDLDDPSLLPAAALGGDALLNALTSSMVPQTAIREVWIGGKQVMKDGAVAGIDREELAGKVRAAAAIRAGVNLAPSS